MVRETQRDINGKREQSLHLIKAIANQVRNMKYSFWLTRKSARVQCTKHPSWIAPISMTLLYLEKQQHIDIDGVSSFMAVLPNNGLITHSSRMIRFIVCDIFIWHFLWCFFSETNLVYSYFHKIFNTSLALLFVLFAVLAVFIGNYSNL